MFYSNERLLAATLGASLLFSHSLTAQDSIQDLVQVSDFSYNTSGTHIDLTTPFDFESATLSVRRRGTTDVWLQTFGPGERITTDLRDFAQGSIEDGRYIYELVFVLASAADLRDSEIWSEESDALAPVTFQNSGLFDLVNGEIGQVTIPGHTPSHGPSSDVPAGASLQRAPKDDGNGSLQNISNSGGLAMGGYGVFGSNDLGDIAPGKVRIRPVSILGGAPYANLTVESVAANGDDYAWHFGTQSGNLGIQRQRTQGGAKTTVLGISEDTRENALMITSNGRIGMGTANPAAQMHYVATSNLFELRMQHTQASWVMGVGEFSGFRIRNVTLGSTPLQILPNAPTNSLRILSDGNVGMGLAAPEASLHVRRTENARIIVEETGAGDANSQFELINNGHPKFLFTNSATNNRWEFRTAGSGSSERFQANRLGSGVLEFQVRRGGDAFFAGNVTANGVLLTSSRETKTDFAPLDTNDVLERLNQLEISQWRYKHESEDTVHFGPIAEEFHEIFGLSNGTHLNLIDTNGIAFAAIQALHQNNQSLIQENQNIMAENKRLAERLSLIERQLNL